MNSCLIYLLDKDPVRGNFLMYHLGSAGFRNVQLFHDQDECNYRIRKNAKPAFIIADASMRGMTDLEFLKFIKTDHQEIRVMFYSENDDSLHISTLLGAGATDYILIAGASQSWIHELILNLKYLIKKEIRIQ